MLLLYILYILVMIRCFQWFTYVAETRQIKEKMKFYSSTEKEINQ